MDKKTYPLDKLLNIWAWGKVGSLIGAKLGRSGIPD
jgi:hypothetical protein